MYEAKNVKPKMERLNISLMAVCETRCLNNKVFTSE